MYTENDLREAFRAGKTLGSHNSYFDKPLDEDEWISKNRRHEPLVPTIEWNSNESNDDFTFKYGDYCLRVEKMNKNHWWWCVYFKTEYVEFDEPKASSEGQAKALAELNFRHHLATHISV